MYRYDSTMYLIDSMFLLLLPDEMMSKILSPAFELNFLAENDPIMELLAISLATLAVLSIGKDITVEHRSKNNKSYVSNNFQKVQDMTQQRLCWFRR